MNKEKAFWDYGSTDGDPIEVSKVDLTESDLRILKEHYFKEEERTAKPTNLTELAFLNPKA